MPQRQTVRKQQMPNKKPDQILKMQKSPDQLMPQTHP
jgi:hypothetical protein